MGAWEVVGLLVIAAGVWLIWDSLAAREAATSAGRMACSAEGWLFLDDTVVIESVSTGRDASGRLRLKRVDGFEYSDTGNNRRRGTLTLLGTTVVTLRLAPGQVSATWH